MSSTPQRLSGADIFGMALDADAQGRTETAEGYLRVLDANADLIPSAARYAAKLEDEGRFEDAERALRLGLRAKPDDRELAGRLGRHRLREGDFAEGWALLETRDIAISAQINGRPRLSTPEWRGEPITSLLVMAEQGLGDQIQFARLIPVLQARGLAVSFACAPPLIPLLAPLGCPLIPTVPGADVPRCDAWVMLMSLPHILGLKLEDIPPPTPIGSASGGVGIGVMTRGNPGHANDRNRSLPPELAAELQALPNARDLHPEATGAADFLATQRIIEGLAEVVTVDTSIAHLAGSMGKPCRVLLPFVPDWRWLRDRTDSPWYPSVRLYRQPAPGDWRSVIDAVAADLPA